MTEWCRTRARAWRLTLALLDANPQWKETTMSSKQFTTFGTLAALQLPEGGKIRTTSDRRISVHDFLRAEGYKNPRQTFERLKKHYPEIVPFCDNFRFPGQRGSETPVVGKDGFETIFTLLPGKRGQAYRQLLLSRPRAT